MLSPDSRRDVAVKVISENKCTTVGVWQCQTPTIDNRATGTFLTGNHLKAPTTLR
jgi:hypothetical protein